MRNFSSTFKTLSVIFVILACLAPANSSAEITKERVKVRLKVPSKFAKGVFSKERRLYAPQGLKISVFAAGLRGVRFMAFDSSGVLYASQPGSGIVVALPDKDRDGYADKVITFAGSLESPHGLAFKVKDLIVAGTGALTLLRDTNGDLKTDIKEVITDDIPGGGGHWTRTVVVAPDGGLFVSAGSSCNVCVEEDGRRAAVLKVEGKKAQIYATGLRNSVGLAFHPDTKELWAVDNGRDWLGDDLPPEELNKIIKGGDYGWPYCYGDRIPDPETGSHQRCKDTIPPVVEMQAHSAPLGIAFGYGLKFPEPFKDALYIAFHGSWNRSTPTGYKLVAVPFKDGKPTSGPVDIITGWLEGKEAWGRPVEPAVGPDGALYLSDDHAGAIYRITAE